MDILKVLAFAILALSVAACKSDPGNSDELIPGISANGNLQVITSKN